MKFKEKYTPNSKKEPNKQVVSDDAYLLAELLTELIQQLKVSGIRK